MLSNFSKTITFIGGGNMAEALITGLLAKGLTASLISVIDPDTQKLQNFADKGVNALNADNLEQNKQHLAKSDIVILAIKPQVVADVLTPFADVWDSQLVISILAGVPLARLESLLGNNVRLVRAMPNTPAMIQQGATGVFSKLPPDDKALATQVLSASGLVLWVENEELLHAVTAVSGSAPAYFFYMFESMIKAGQNFGLTEEQAKNLAIQAALGSAKMALESQDSTAVLRQKVTSPNGTTHSAICVFDDNQFGEIVEKAMQACVNRSIELSKN